MLTGEANPVRTPHKQLAVVPGSRCCCCYEFVVQPVVQLLQYLYTVLDSKLRAGEPGGDLFSASKTAIVEGGILTPARRSSAGARSSNGTRSPSFSPRRPRFESIRSIELNAATASCRRRAHTERSVAKPKRSLRKSLGAVALHSVKPVRGVIRHTLPMPAQRSMLPQRLQGELRIAPKRQERLDDALLRGHLEGAEAFLKGRAAADPTAAHGGWLKGSFVPVGAVPMLLVVPACLACSMTRTFMGYFTILPCICVLVMTGVSKLVCDDDYDM